MHDQNHIKSIILVAGANVRGYWQGRLGHGFDLYAMGCRRNVWYSPCLSKDFCWKGLYGCSRQSIGCHMTVIYRKKTLLRTGMLQELNVGQHHCENLLQYFKFYVDGTLHRRI
jgi:hypothetical protein